MKKIAALFILSVIAIHAVGQGRSINSNNAVQPSENRNVYNAPVERNTYNTNYNNTSRNTTQRAEVINSAASDAASNKYVSATANRPSISTPARTYGAAGAGSYTGYYSSGARPIPSAGYVNRAFVPGNTSHYNYVSKKTYPSFSARDTRHKSHRHECDSVRICPPPLQDYYLRSIPYYYFAGYCSYFNEWCQFDEWFSQPGQTVTLKSFDGYLIYGYDTMSGIITMDKKEAYLEQPLSRTKEYASTVRYKDKNLKGIVLFAGHHELHLTKLPGDNELRRVLHAGRLIICDASYNFPSPANVHHATITVFDPVLNIRKKIRSKEHLVEQINEAYGTSLNADSYNWTKLFELIDKLQ